MLLCFRVSIASADSGRISSDNAMYPASSLLISTNTTVSVSLAVNPSGMDMFLSFKYPGLTTNICFPSTVASTPLPVMALKFSVAGMVIFKSFTFCKIPVAMGCSDFCSKADARRSSSFSVDLTPSPSPKARGTTFDTSNLPTVNVPVLSKTIVVIFLAFSKAVRFFISNPFFADKAVDFATIRGTANPNACGQQITITVTILSIAKANDCPVIYQYKNVAIPASNAIMVNHFAALSANNCVFDLEFCASCTNLITCDK